MNWFVQIILPIIISTVVTGVLGFIVKRWIENIYKKEDARQKEEEQNKQELENYRKAEQKVKNETELKQTVENLLKPLSAELANIKKEINETNNTIKDINGTNVCILRNALQNNYDRCTENGYRTNWDTTNFDDLYKEYHRLGGNSYIDNLKNRFY